jgi:uncharacterized cupredoxin-like copper-binding protein
VLEPKRRGKGFMKRFHLGILALSLFCLMQAIFGGVSFATPPKSTPPPSQTTTKTPPQAQTIKITIGDFYIHSPVTTFTTGKLYEFVITNRGKHYHNFLLIHPTKTIMTPEDVYMNTLAFASDIAPNETTSTHMLFDHTAPPGMLEFSCHYGGHYEAGMHQAIVVKAAPGTSASPYPNNGIPLYVTPQASRPCDPVATTKIANNVYTPAKLSLKVREIFTITNTGSPYTPTFSPGGATMMLGGPKNTLSFSFSFPGVYMLSSKEHPKSKATILVSTTAGSTCGITPVTTAYFSTSYSDPKIGQFFTPTHLTIKKGQSIEISNLLDQDLTFISTPNAGLGTINIVHYDDINLLFTAKGSYTISCVKFPAHKLTVTVQ